jgi:mRNA-degrading endonuclease toxin of MazEF toxin-antitoxin module
MTSLSVPSPGDVILITFEFLDHTGSKLRPAVVVSHKAFNEHWGRFIFAPISRSPGSIEGAIEIQDISDARLNFRSYCHGILFTAENNAIQKTLGQLSSRDMDTIRKMIRQTLAI